MVVRIARLQDAPAMARVNLDMSVPEHRDWMEESARNWARAMREIEDGTCPRNCIYIAEEPGTHAFRVGGGEIVGFVIGGPPRGEAPEATGEVYNLSVEERYRRLGLGRRLVQAVAAHLAQMGMPALLIGCLATNETGRRFYEALGGHVIGERHVHEDGPEVIYGWSDTRALVGTRGAADETKR